MFLLAEGTDMFRIGAVGTGGNVNPSGNLSFRKELWLDGCLGVEPRRDGLTLASRPLRLLTFLNSDLAIYSAPE